MAQFIPDDIDFTAYERDTECKAKVRRASDFSEDLDAEFEPRSGQRKASMFSTKLRDAIEFRPGEVTCWAGFNGHRKSMFTGQVALDLCVQRERTLIVSLEMKPRKTLARICRQAAARAVPTVDERRQFMRWTDDRLWLFDHEGRLLPDRAIAVCRYFAKELGGKHIFIDSMMKVVQSEESLDEQKRMVGDLCDVAKETGLHLHLVAHCRKPNGGRGQAADEVRHPRQCGDQRSGLQRDPRVAGQGQAREADRAADRRHAGRPRNAGSVGRNHRHRQAA